ncbi:MAG TPA: hypothetical protein VGN03_11160 [Steroidobacteraceae bacterium]
MLERSGESNRSARLQNDLELLKSEAHGPPHGIVIDGNTARDQMGRGLEGHGARTYCLHRIADRARSAHIAFAPVRDERTAHVIAGGRLDRDHFRAAAEVLFGQGGSCDQAAATDRAENDIETQFLPVGIDQYLTHQCGLPGNDEGVIERVQQRTVLLLCDLARAVTRDFLPIAVPMLSEHDSGAGPLRELDLAPRSIVGHDDRDGHARSMSCQCERLSEIARRKGDDTPLALLPGQTAYTKVSASHLEGAADLEGFGFEEYVRADE